METRQAYNLWSEQYDTNDNKTRDLEAVCLRDQLKNLDFQTCLEIGCGTGKNTTWLVNRARAITAVDLSEEMLARARKKITSSVVRFVQADIRENWTFTEAGYNLVTFSLVLEHIEQLDHIFQQVSSLLAEGGYVYIGELHPFKQYTGTKARFETENGLQVVDCYMHHVSDFIRSAAKYNLVLADLNEYFDDNNRNSIPRILTLLLRKETH